MTTIPISASVVILRDHVAGSTRSLIYDGAAKEAQLRRFHEKDPLLAKLQSQPVFQGKLTYASLDPYHYRVLIALHLSLIDDLPKHERLDNTNPSVRSLDFLFVALLLCLEMRTQGNVEMLSIDRVSETKLVYKLSANLDEMAFPQPASPKFRVIVDNC